MGWQAATDGDAIHDNVASEISAIAEKAVPVNADLVVIEDSAAANVKKRVQLGNLPGGGGGGDPVPTWVQRLDVDAGAVASLDEFDDAAFTGWTTVTISGGQTITEDIGLLSINPTSAITTTDTNCILKANSIPIGDAVEVAVVGHTNDDAQLQTFGPVITDGTSAGSNQVWNALIYQSNVEQFYPATGTLTANGLAGGAIGHLVRGTILYMRMEYDASNSFKSWYSIDRITWFNVHTLARTMTPTHIGFGWNTVANSPVGMSVTIEYVRRVTV